MTTPTIRSRLRAKRKRWPLTVRWRYWLADQMFLLAVLVDREAAADALRRRDDR